MLKDAEYDLALISEVKRYPLLYSGRNAKCTKQKQDIWKEIALKLRKSSDPYAVQMVRIRWKRLRFGLVKGLRQPSEIRRRKPKKDWRVFEALQFFIPYLDAPNIKKDNQHLPETKVVFLDSEHLKEKVPEPEEDIKEVVHKVEEIDCHDNPVDDIDIFFNGLADTVRKLSPENQAKVKKEISNIMLDANLWKISEIKEEPGI